MNQILSYGGGTQTVAMCILVGRGVLPRPDRIIMADTSRETRTTFDYLEEWIRPYLHEHDLEVEVASHELATVDLYSGNGDLLLPVFTKGGKLETFCSNEWKARVVQRYLRAAGINGAEQWIGFTLDERQRVKGYGDRKWPRRYPLLDLMLTSADCHEIIRRQGWPLPSKSRCWMCPHQSNAEWRQLKRDAPDQWAQAVELDEDIRALDGKGGVFLHQFAEPLAEADIEAPDRHEDAGKPCGLGMCLI